MYVIALEREVLAIEQSRHYHTPLTSLCPIYSWSGLVSRRLQRLCSIVFKIVPPFPSNRHHRSNGDCLEGKRENYQVCSVQYCVQQLYTVNCIVHTHVNGTSSSLDWVLSHWADFAVLRFIFVYVLFCV